MKKKVVKPIFGKLLRGTRVLFPLTALRSIRKQMMEKVNILCREKLFLLAALPSLENATTFGENSFVWKHWPTFQSELAQFSFISVRCQTHMHTHARAQSFCLPHTLITINSGWKGILYHCIWTANYSLIMVWSTVLVCIATWAEKPFLHGDNRRLMVMIIRKFSLHRSETKKNYQVQHHFASLPVLFTQYSAATVRGEGWGGGFVLHGKRNTSIR